MRKRTSPLIILMFICIIVVEKATAKDIIKFGTLATEGSAWGKTFSQMNVELLKKSEGELQFRFYWGRDEKDLVELIKSRQLDAVSLTSVGLTQVLSAASIFQLPMLFSTYEELDYVKENLTPQFLQQFKEKGYVFLGWADLGFIYLFSKHLIKSQTDLQKTRIWVRAIDPIAKAYVSAAEQDPVLLSIESVLPSLTENEIQTVYTSPLACIVFQWHTQINYMTDLRLAAGVGVTIIDKGRFDKLSNEHQSLLREITEKYHEQLKVVIRESNAESIRVLQDQEIHIVSVLPKEEEKWRQTAKEVQNQFVGQLYERELLDRVRDLISQYHIKGNQ